MARLEKTTRNLTAGECRCHGARGVSGPRWTVSYERPDLQPPEALASAERDTDHVERCLRCGKVRPIIEAVYVENWHEGG
jgi:hypothetical protein